MSRVITFSRVFPATHPRKGEETGFVQKIWIGLIESELISLSRCCELSRETGIGDFNMNNIRKCEITSKHHTIRAGNRWKVGDKFSPRVWGTDINPKTGKSGPRQSKQIIIAPDIEIVKIWTFQIVDLGGVLCMRIDGLPAGQLFISVPTLIKLAKNEGLSAKDFIDWFAIHPKKKNREFFGQILCWNEDIIYSFSESNSRMNNQLAKQHAAIPHNQ